MRHSVAVRKVLLAPSAYYPSLGGVEELTRKLAATYVHRGLNVQIVTARMPGSQRSDVVDGIRVSRFLFYTPAKSPYHILRFVFWFPLELLRLLWIVLWFQPDVLHVQCNGSNTYYVYCVSVLTGIPVVDTLQGETVMDEHGIYQRSLFFKQALRKIVHRAATVTACSAATLTEALQYGDFRKKSAVVFNGISLPEFAVKTAPVRGKYIFATGRFTYNKGFDLLIRAFAEVAAEDKSLQLFIGGDGKERQAAERLVRQLRVGTRVKLLGRITRDQTVQYMQHSVFVVMPSRYEPFGIVALEGMAAGKAVLVTCHGGPPEYVFPDVQGKLVDPNNIGDFIEKIHWMLKHHRRLEKNIAGYIERFSWERIAEQYLEIYARVKR